MFPKKAELPVFRAVPVQLSSYRAGPIISAVESINSAQILFLSMGIDAAIELFVCRIRAAGRRFRLAARAGGLAVRAVPGEWDRRSQVSVTFWV